MFLSMSKHTTLTGRLATLVDGSLRGRVIHIAAINDDIARSNTLLDKVSLTVHGIHTVLHGNTAHIGRLLSNHQIDHAVLQVVNCLHRRIKIGNLDLSLPVSILDGLRGTLRAEQIGSKDAVD